MNPTCLATAVEQGIACTWVVMNKCAFGTVFQTPDGEVYSPNELVAEGKLIKKENGKYVPPSHAKSHKTK